MPAVVLFENGKMSYLIMGEGECYGVNLDVCLTSKALNAGDTMDSEAWVPDREEIERECRLIRSRWDSREQLLRKLRAMMACESGICRNH